ncbi:MAG: hypothetical protein J2P31_16240, partial [Blastocatellia bacterium]|nr:hypothetical protein [Blastocatellia bacterium]
MPDAELKSTVETLCPDIEGGFIAEFFARMDEDYFAAFSAEEIARHVKMSHSLDTSHTVRCRFVPRDGGEFDIIIVGFDYLSEFSLICGLLSAFGLDIQSGKIYSFAKPSPAAAVHSPRIRRHHSRTKRPGQAGQAGQASIRIVDVFTVRPRERGDSSESFDEAGRSAFEEELQRLVRQLAAGSFDEVRDRLNRLLTDRLERVDGSSGLLSPVEVIFDNRESPDWTLMDVRSVNAFAFLYALSNALAMRGIYIHKVMIESAGNEARDRFFIADRWGRKIESDEKQEQLRQAVLLIKKFTWFLPEASDPARAMRHFDQFLDKVAEEQISDHLIS